MQFKPTMQWKQICIAGFFMPKKASMRKILYIILKKFNLLLVKDIKNYRGNYGRFIT